MREPAKPLAARRDETDPREIDLRKAPTSASELDRTYRRNESPEGRPAQRPQAGVTHEALKSDGAGSAEAPSVVKPVDKPDFGLSGALAQDAATGNTLNGVLLKFSEPAEARNPTTKWRLHVFKGDTQLEKPLHVHRQSAYLIGRDRRIADIPADHPSCSSQHAVLQYRLVALPVDPGDMAPPVRVVKPYVMDLESTNGTFVNGSRIPTSRYYELKPADVLKFGLSSREYVLMHDDMA